MPYWSDERLEAERDRNLRRTVRFAAATVPYYRDLFPSLRLDPREIRSVADLRLLPILDKPTVQADPQAFVSDSSRAGKGDGKSVEFRTSGSTGTPLPVVHDTASIVMNVAHAEPEKEVIREIFGRRPYREIGMLPRTSNVPIIQSIYRERILTGRRPRSRFLNIDEPFEDLVASINRLKPEVLTGYGSFLESLFRFVHAAGLSMHMPRLIVYGADGLTTPGRELIEKTLGVEVLSRYNAIESFRIGFTCRAGPGFHLRDDLCHLRIVDAQGVDVPNGVEGTVVMSNFVNRGTVLLNYRLGDAGVIDDCPCPCGRRLRRLAELHGRVEDQVRLADGRLVHPRMIWSVFRKCEGILRFQVVQESVDTFTVRLVVRDRAVFQELLPRLRADLGERLGQGDIRFEFFERPEELGTGKFRAVVSKVVPVD